MSSDYITYRRIETGDKVVEARKMGWKRFRCTRNKIDINTHTMWPTKGGDVMRILHLFYPFESVYNFEHSS